MSKTKLCAAGHIATTHQLVAMGASLGVLSRAVRDGRLIRLRHGVYACPHVPVNVATAARIGGALTCVSVLRDHDVWAGTSLRLHVQVPPNARNRDGGSAHLHWAPPQFPMATPWEAGRMQALWQAIRCLEEEHAIAALESALKTRFLTPNQVSRITDRAPARLDDGIGRMIVNSGSGLETIARLRLARAGFELAAQATVPGLGHQDLLVNGCVGLEIDGEKWHGADQFHADRERDIHAARLGRRTLRLTSRQVLDDWPDTLSAIERAVADSQFARASRK